MLPPHAWHGQGDPLLLIAGLGAKGTSWYPFLPAAAERHAVLTFDNRGSGRAAPADAGLTIRTLAEDVLRLLDAQHVERIAVVGRSMGGMIAQELALLAPTRVSRLVLTCTTGRVDAHLAAVFRSWAELAEGGVPAPIRHRASMLWCLGSEALGRDAGTYLETRARADRPEDYAHQAQACAEHDALDRLAEVTCPTLVVAGTDDRLTPLPHARALASAIPNGELIAIPGAGHLAYLETPARFQAAVLDFVAKGRVNPRGVSCRNASIAS